MNLTAEGTALLTLRNGAGKVDLLSGESATLLTVGDWAGEGDVLIVALGVGGTDDVLPWLGLWGGRLVGRDRHDC